MALHTPVVRKRGAAVHGREAGQLHIRAEGRRRLDRWCRLYREGGADALRSKPKGRPKGAKAKPRGLTREQELEEHCRRLETEVAYLKNCAPW